MENISVLYLLFVLGVFEEGVKSVVQTQQTVLAVFGEEAHLRCQLMQPKAVLQVTWQIILPDGEKNLGTYNKYFGQRVTPDFRDNVEFKIAGLRNSSILIRKVAVQDEGCYRCLFNTYPDGALSARTCLKLYELHEPILQLGQSNSPKESVVSCSATGRPAPTVTLNVTQPHLYFSHYNTVSVNNTNGTVTVTTTAVLSGSRDNSTQVGCAVRVFSGPQKDVFMMLPEVRQTSADDFTFIIIMVLVSFGACVLPALVAGVVIVLRKRENKISEPEKTKTPHKTTNDTQQIVTPLIKMVYENVKQGTSVKKRPKGDEPSHSGAKCLRKLFSNSETE